jgi:hypothetical protein
MSLLFVGLIGLCFAIAFFRHAFINWRQALIAVLVLVIFEGALRKWILPQASDLLYFLKDLVLIPVYLSRFGTQRATENKVVIPEALKFLLGVNVLWCLIQIFNPALGSPLVGILGLRAYLFYIPLMWLIPQIFADQEAFVRFLRYYLLLSIPVGVLGIVQYFAPASSPINVYVADAAIATVGENARITGTFSFLTGYAMYLMINFSLLIPLLLSRQPRKWQWVTFIELVLIVANALMTGSRSVVLAQILILVGFFSIYVLLRPAYWLSLVLKFALPATVLCIALFFVFQPALDSFIYRATTSDSISGRLTWYWRNAYDFIPHAGLSGYGTGATHAGGQTLRRQLGLPAGETIPVAYEPEMGRVMLELGPFGFLLWYGLRIYLAILHWRVFLRLKSPLLRNFALSAFLVSILH